MAAGVGCLPNGNNVINLQFILYFTASFLGFFVTIPLGIVLRNFQGSCILFAQIVQWETAIIWPWSETSCDFVLYVNLAINIFYATFMGVVVLFMRIRRTTIKTSTKISNLDDWHVSFVLNGLNPIFLFVNSLILVMEVSGAAIITAGLSSFCNFTLGYAQKLPTSGVNGTSYVPTSCSGLDSRWNDQWQKLNIVRGTGAGVNGSNFYGCLTVASIASWLLMIVWILHIALNVAMSCRTCSCDIAEEKRKGDQSMIIAQRRSRLQTPIATPGGFMTPSQGRHTPQTLGGPGGSLLPHPTGQPHRMVPMGVSGPPQQQQQMGGPPRQQYDMPDNGTQFNHNSPPSSTSEKQPLPEDSYEEDQDQPPQYEPPPTMRAQPTTKQVYKKAPYSDDMI